MSKRTTYLPFALPDIGDDEIREVGEVLRSGWITTGPKAHLFERQFAEYVGARYAVSVNSCTAAMHVALEAVGVAAGDFVVTTAYTFAATAEVIRYFDATPVFVDIEPETLNIDPAALEHTLQDLEHWRDGGKAELPGVVRAIGQRHSASAIGSSLSRTSRTAAKAIIPVHIAGQPCEMERIGASGVRHGASVIEDAAHACSATYGGKRVGAELAPGIPVASCFSFYATKTLATGEGGMVTTDNEQCADRMRLMSLHGISKDAWKRYTAEGSWYYEIVAPGFKYNMPDVIAAIGLAQLRKVDEMRRRREQIARRYSEAFAPYVELETPITRPGIGHAWHLYVLRLRPDALSIDRDEFVNRLRSEQIGASVHFIPLHLHPYYRTMYGYEPSDFPIAFREYGRAISLPIYSKMKDFDVESVIDAVTEIVRGSRARTSYAIAGR